MKKVILLAACLFTLLTAASPQEAPAKPTSTGSVSAGTRAEHAKGEPRQKLTHEQRAQKQVDGLNAEVTLTEAQKPKVYDLALAKIKKVEEIRSKYKGQPENKETSKTEIETVRKEFRQNVKALLTPEQLEKLKAKHKEMKDAGKSNSLDHDN